MPVEGQATEASMSVTAATIPVTPNFHQTLVCFPDAVSSTMKPARPAKDQYIPLYLSYYTNVSQQKLPDVNNSKDNTVSLSARAMESVYFYLRKDNLRAMFFTTSNNSSASLRD